MLNPPASLSHLSARLGLQEPVTSLSSQLLSAFQRTEGSGVQSTQISADFACRCAVLAASRLVSSASRTDTASVVSLTQVLGDLETVDMHAFLLCLKKFTEKVPMQDSVKLQLTSIKTGFAFAYTFYRKFEEIWQSFSLEDDLSRHLAWLLFLVCKSNLLNRRTEVVDCSFILISTLHFTLTRYPFPPSNPYLSLNSSALLSILSGFLKTQAKYVEPYLEKIVTEVRSLVQQRWVVKTTSDVVIFADIFGKREKNEQIVKDLSRFYERKLQAEDMDEREFLKPGKIVMSNKEKVPLTPFSRQKVVENRLAHWDPAQSSPCLGGSKTSSASALTPMTQAMQMNNWLASVTDSVSGVSLTQPILTFCQMCETDPEALISTHIETSITRLEKVFKGKKIGLKGEDKTESESNSKVIIVIKLYLHLLHLMLDTEQRTNSKANFSLILPNLSFHRSLLASSLEAVLYLHNISSISFEEILSICQINAFDFWKIITSFCNVDKHMPGQIKAHFRMIEVRIISVLGWTGNSPVIRAIQGLKVKQEIEAMHMTYDLFFRRVLSFTAYRVFTVTEELRLQDDIREEIWSFVKFLLSEHTELLLDRHLDQLILCGIFGICRWKGQAVKWMTLVRVYSCFCPEETAVVTEEVRLGVGQGSLLELFNESVLPLIREFTLGNRRPDSIRLHSFSPTSSLQASISPQFRSASLNSLLLTKSPFRSPYMTPVTQRLFVSPQCHPSDKHLDFEREEMKYRPSKKPRHLQEILAPNKEDLVLPHLSS